MRDHPTRFYSPENFDFSYAYNEMTHHDYEVESQKDQNLQLAANYGHSFKPIEINPFRKILFLSRKKYLQWFKEINLNVMPSSLEITSNINRNFSSQRF